MPRRSHDKCYAWFHVDVPEGFDSFPARIVSVGHAMSSSEDYCFDSVAMQEMNPKGFHFILLSLSGSGRAAFKKNGRWEERPLAAGSLFMGSHSAAYRYWFPGGEPWTWLWAVFQGELADRVFLGEAGGCETVPCPLESSLTLSLKALLASEAGRRLDPYRMQAAACELLIDLKELVENRAQDAKAKALREAERLVNAKLSSINAQGLAKAWGYDRRHFQRWFRKTSGKTPGEFIREKRLSAAANFISGSSFTLEEIAAKTGFANGSHLCRAFRKRFGASPASWRGKDMPWA